MSRPSSPGSTVFIRDRVTAAGYAVLGTWAWFLYGFGAVLPLLRAEEGVSRSVLGLHSVALAAGGLVSGALVVPLVRRMHRRGCFTLAAGVMCAGVLLLVSTRQPALTIAAAGIVGIGGAMLVNTAVPALSDHHGTAAPTAISEANAFAAGVGLLAPTAVGLAVGLGWSWRPAALLALPMALALLLLVRRVPAGTPAVDGDPGGAGAAGGRLPTAARILIVLVVVCVAIEFCCTAWSADLLRTRTGLSAGAAASGVTAVVAGMALGRVVVGRLALRHPARRLLLGALVLTAVGWTVTWVATAPGVLLAGLAVIGLGIAAHYPLGAALVYGAAPGQADLATGRLSLGVAVAAGAGPFALGAIADASSTHTAFVAVPLLVVAALGALLAAVRHSRTAPGEVSRPAAARPSPVPAAPSDESAEDAGHRQRCEQRR